MMAFLSHSKIHPSVRFLQMLIAMAFFIFICYCAIHHGWWMESRLSGIVAMGIFVALITIVDVTLHFVRRSLLPANRPPAARVALSKSRLAAACVWNVILSVMYMMIAVFMFRDDKGKDFTKALDKPPVALWNTAGALAVVESATYILTTYLTVQEDREATVGDGSGGFFRY